MSQKSIEGSERLANGIKNRRKELGLTIEMAASRAGVGIKTWCRYEAGESIRKDKVKGICKALNWRTLLEADADEDDEISIDNYRKDKVWSKYLEENYGEEAAAAFVIGSEILLDYLKEDLEQLSNMPVGSHVGQINISMMKNILPEQFITRYDYELLYCLKSNILLLRKQAEQDVKIIAHTVIQELALYLIAQEAEFFVECICDEIGKVEFESSWVFDMFDDMDIVTCLYSNTYLVSEDIYHFDHWCDWQFYVQ